LNRTRFRPAAPPYYFSIDWQALREGDSSSSTGFLETCFWDNFLFCRTIRPWTAVSFAARSAVLPARIPKLSDLKLNNRGLMSMLRSWDTPREDYL